MKRQNTKLGTFPEKRTKNKQVDLKKQKKREKSKTEVVSNNIKLPENPVKKEEKKKKIKISVDPLDPLELNKNLKKKIAHITKTYYNVPNHTSKITSKLKQVIEAKKRAGEDEKAQIIKRCIEKKTKEMYNSKEYKEYIAAKIEFGKRFQNVCKLATYKKLDNKEIEKRMLLDGPVRGFFQHWNQVFDFEGGRYQDASDSKQDLMSLMQEVECKIVKCLDRCLDKNVELDTIVSKNNEPFDNFQINYLDRKFKEHLIKILRERKMEMDYSNIMRPAQYEGQAPVDTAVSIMTSFRLKQFYKENWWAKYVESLHPWEQRYTLDQAVKLRSYVTTKKHWMQYRKGKYKPKYKRAVKKEVFGGKRKERSIWKF